MEREEAKEKTQQVPVLLERMYLINAQLNRIVKGIQSKATRRKMSVRMTASFEELMAWCGTYGLKAAIVLCYSQAAAEVLVRRFCENGVHPVFVNMELADHAYPYSAVMQDYTMSCYRLVKEFAARGVRKVAYVGNNPDSYTDQLRLKGLSRAAAEEGLSYDRFDNDGALDRCVCAFLPHIDAYDAVICVNDIVALMLVQSLEDPAEHKIAGFGGMAIGQEIGGFTTIVLDNFSSGMHAVDLYTLLSKQDDVANVTMTVASKLVLGHAFGSRLQEPSPKTRPQAEKRRIDFYQHEFVQRSTGLENLLLNCDDVDRSILRSLLAGERYNDIEETAYISTNTIKFRINKMVKNAGVADKTHLLELVRAFRLTFE